jgi:hypothetical protein
MELTTAHLFVLLLLALVLCSFFGGACDFDNGISLEGFHNDSPYRYSDYTTMYRDNAKTGKSLLSSSDDTVSKYKYKKRTNGIRANQILRGNEDLYILKSEVVPPVCPACPAPKCNNNNNNHKGTGTNNNNNNVAGSDSKCPPCPPCARCPEPAFECKKVPNYGRTNDDTMPSPVLKFGL